MWLPHSNIRISPWSDQQSFFLNPPKETVTPPPPPQKGLGQVTLMCPDRGLHFGLLGCWCVPAADRRVFRWRRWGRAARGMRVFGWCWGWGCDGRPAFAARGESPRTPCPSPLWPPQWTAQVRRHAHTSHVNVQPFTTRTEPHPAHITHVLNPMLITAQHTKAA